MRVVADTNVYISGLMFGGLPEIVLQMGLAGVYELVITEALLLELDEKLRGKFGVSRKDAAAIQARLQSAAWEVSPEFILDAVRDDPDDNRVLECAVAGRANVVVSGDRHLLRIGKYENIPILTTRQFLEAIGWRG